MILFVGGEGFICLLIYCGEIYLLLCVMTEGMKEAHVGMHARTHTRMYTQFVHREKITDLLFYKDGCLRGTHELYGGCLTEESPLYEVSVYHA